MHTLSRLRGREERSGGWGKRPGTELAAFPLPNLVDS